MTAAALFFLRNSSFLLRSLWIICRRCSTGRRWIFTLCPGGGPRTPSLSVDARTSSHSFLHPDLNSSVPSGKSEETPPISLSWVTLFLGVRWWRGLCSVRTTSCLALPGRLDPAGEHLSLSWWARLFWEAAPPGLGALSCLLLGFLGLSCWEALAGLESSPFSAGRADPEDKGCLALLGPASHWCSPRVSPLHFGTEDDP